MNRTKSKLHVTVDDAVATLLTSPRA